MASLLVYRSGNPVALNCFADKESRVGANAKEVIDKQHKADAGFRKPPVVLCVFVVDELYFIGLNDVRYQPTKFREARHLRHDVRRIQRLVVSQVV